MNEFDKIRELWPGRQIFQGAARSYIRYSEKEHTPWERFEKPLWKGIFQELGVKEAVVLDIGSGPGKLVDLLIEEGTKPENIFALEPNSILIDFLYGRGLGINCIIDSSHNLDNPIMQNHEFDLVCANMVVNHLSNADFDKLVKDSSGTLGLKGFLIYTTPNPCRKEAKYGLDGVDNSTVIIENAPWGGLVEYHHRSIDYQRKILENLGFNPYFYFDGYDDTFHTMDGPKRMMVVAQNMLTNSIK